MTIRERFVAEGKEGFINASDRIRDKIKAGTNNSVWHQTDRYGNVVYRVEGNAVLVGLGAWETLIDLDERFLKNTPLLDALSIYADSELDVSLHNYANCLVHGSEPFESIEELRDLSYFVDSINQIQYAECFREMEGEGK